MEIQSIEDLTNAMSVSLDAESSHEDRTGASNAVERYMTEPESFMGFISVISNEPRGHLRHQAAVFLLRVVSHWANLGRETKDQLKAAMLESLFSEPERLVRKNLCVAVAVVARRELVVESWDDFLPLVHSAASSDDVSAREIGFAILKRLVRFFGTNDPGFFEQLVPLWNQGLNDPESSSVVLDAFAGLAMMSAYFEEPEELEAFRPLLQEMLAAVARLVGDSQVNSSVKALGILEDMLQIAPGLVALVWANLVRFSVQLVQECDNEDIHQRALSSLAKYVRLKPLMVLKHDLLEDVLNAAFVSIVVPETDVDEGNSIPSNAQTLIDQICLAIGPSYTFPLCMNAASECLSQGSENTAVIRGGLMILAMCAEGCQAYMREEMDTLIDAVKPHMNSEDELVRDAVMMVLYQFADHMRPQSHQYPEVIIRGALGGLQDGLLSTRMSAMRAINGYIVFLEVETIAEYLEDIMEGYVGVIMEENPEPPLMCGALTGIGMLAQSVKSLFTPFFEPSMELLMDVITYTEDEMLSLRARAIEAIGGVAQAGGREAFAPYMEAVMANAFEGLSLSYCALREFTYSFFGRIAVLLGEDFLEYFVEIFPILKKICEAPDMAVFTGEVLVDDEYEVTDDDYEVPLDAQEEKGGAAYCIGTCADAIGPAFLPYVKDSLDVLETLLNYDNADVRAAVVSSICDVASIVPLAEEWDSPIPGLPLDPATPSSIQELAAYLMPKYLLRMYHEDDVEVVSRALSTLTKLVRLYGPAFFSDEHDYQLFSKICLLILQRELACQQPLDEAELEYAEDELDSLTAGSDMAGHGTELDTLDVEVPIDLATLETDFLAELIDAAISVLGPAFAPCFEDIFPSLVDRSGPTRPVYERCTSLGVLSSVTTVLGPALGSRLGEIVLPLFFQGCTDESEDVRRNAVFGLGIIMESMTEVNYEGVSFEDIVSPVLEAVSHVLTAECIEDSASVDNGVATLARMVASAPPETVPLEEVLKAMVSNMPLGADRSENTVVYSTLLSLFSNSNEHVFAHLPDLLEIFALDVSTEGALSQDTMFSLGLLIHELMTNDQLAGEVSRMMEGMDAELGDNLVSLAQQAKAAQ